MLHAAQVLTNPHMLLVTLLLCNSAAMEVSFLQRMAASTRCTTLLMYVACATCPRAQ